MDTEEGEEKGGGKTEAEAEDTMVEEEVDSDHTTVIQKDALNVVNFDTGQKNVRTQNTSV